MSRYLYNAAYYWEVVVDSRSPDLGFPVFLEERSTGHRRLLRSVPNRKELENFCRHVQKDLYLSEEEFEAKYEVRLSHPAPESPNPTDNLTQAA
jgi:hypothetical protein